MDPATARKVRQRRAALWNRPSRAEATVEGHGRAGSDARERRQSLAKVSPERSEEQPIVQTAPAFTH